MKTNGTFQKFKTQFLDTGAIYGLLILLVAVLFYLYCCYRFMLEYYGKPF